MLRQSSYLQTRERLEEIVTQIKAKDVPLEKSLDLYEEALRLGASCAEMIDNTDFSSEELESAADIMDGDDADDDGAAEAVVSGDETVAEDAGGEDVAAEDTVVDDDSTADDEDVLGGQTEADDGTDDIYADADAQDIDSFVSQGATETDDSNAY